MKRLIGSSGGSGRGAGVRNVLPICTHKMIGPGVKIRHGFTLGLIQYVYL